MNTNITLTDNISGQLSFTWSHAPSRCPTLHYDILASNCGSCPTTTTHNTVTCTDVPTDGSLCTFALRSVICGNITGNWSETVHVTTFKGMNLASI